MAQDAADQRLPAVDLRGETFEGQLIAPQADLAVQESLERAQVGVVLAHQLSRHAIIKVDVLGHGLGAHAASPLLTFRDPSMAGPGPSHADRRSLTSREATLPSTLGPP